MGKLMDEKCSGYQDTSDENRSRATQQRQRIIQPSGSMNQLTHKDRELNVLRKVSNANSEFKMASHREELKKRQLSPQNVSKKVEHPSFKVVSVPSNRHKALKSYSSSSQSLKATYTSRSSDDDRTKENTKHRSSSRQRSKSAPKKRDALKAACTHETHK